MSDLLCFDKDVVELISEALYCYERSEDGCMSDDEFVMIEKVKQEIFTYLDRLKKEAKKREWMDKHE